MLSFINPWTGEIETATIAKDTYVFKGQGRMYLGLMTLDPDFGFMTPYCDITVNLPDEELTDDTCAFVDTNNAPFLPKFLEENGLAKPTGMHGFSGWCAYPEYRFDMEKVNKDLWGDESAILSRKGYQ